MMERDSTMLYLNFVQGFVFVFDVFFLVYIQYARKNWLIFVYFDAFFSL